MGIVNVKGLSKFVLPLALIAMPAIAQAQDVVASLARGVLVVTAEGRRVGVIDSLIGPKDAPEAVKVVMETRVVKVPVSTLSASDKKGRVVTSMAYRDIR